MPQNAQKTPEELIAEGHTPMMAQYYSIKARYPDALLFYRMGDFYELFHEDAETAAAILDITLTKRGKTQGTDISMCGVPFHSYEPYLARLIRAGHKVAICEQTETPDEAKARAKKEGKPASKALVNRDVVRVVTQGTLTEDSLLNARENNYLSALSHVGGQAALAWLQLSTGEFYVQAIDEHGAAAALERINPGELLIPDDWNNDLAINSQLSTQPRSLFDSENARLRLEKLFGVETLESFGGFSRAEISAAGALIDYVERTQLGHLPYIAKPKQVSTSGTLEIDAATRRNLELTSTMSGEKKGSLLATIDRTITPPGARLLQSHLSAPLTDLAAINKRLDYIATFLANIGLCEETLSQMKAVPDMERALARLTAGRGGPRDLAMIRDGLKQTELIRSLLQNNESAREALKDILKNLTIPRGTAELLDQLKQALSEDVPALARDGGFIAAGYHARLDELKKLRDDSRRLIAALQGKYQKQTGVEALKIKFNNVLGYFIEVPAKKADPLMELAGQDRHPFVHRQTLANVVRFTTPELAELERDIASAADKALALELEIFATLTETCRTQSENIMIIARALAAIDLAAAHATHAQEMNYTRPALNDSTDFNIEGGRHPVVEAALKSGNESFVPNHCDLGEDQKLWLLTGPNMAGKSTFLRQNALITILAQAGCYVPADTAQIGLVDRVFSRVGASDDLARGRSTFMVEMVETAAILNQATDRSLVILDEIGRGTATFDGLSIAWACVEHLHEVNQCRALFATHYHELTALTAKLSSLSCHSMQVKEWKGDIIFMHSVGEGAADRSYGIHVGKLAGLPGAVIARAEEVLTLLQSGEQSGALAKLSDDLPLFSNTPPQEEQTSELEDFLSALDPDALTPREALEALYKLKGLV